MRKKYALVRVTLSSYSKPDKLGYMDSANGCQSSCGHSGSGAPAANTNASADK